ncbi:MAG TPA: nuclear transport factor 2 family protein, partial [Polyangiaceae bacterium]
MRSIVGVMVLGLVMGCGGASDQPPVQAPPAPAPPAPVVDTTPAPTATVAPPAPKPSMAEMQMAALKTMTANMNDAAKVAALYAPDAVMWMPGFPESKGREAIQKGYQDWLAMMSNMQSVNTRSWAKGNVIAVEWVTTAT